MGFKQNAFLVPGMQHVNVNILAHEMDEVDLVEQLRVVQLFGRFQSGAQFLLFEKPWREKKFIFEQPPQGTHFEREYLGGRAGVHQARLLCDNLNPEGRENKNAAFPAPDPAFILELYILQE
jgi:hypothetical protein